MQHVIPTGILNFGIAIWNAIVSSKSATAKKLSISFTSRVITFEEICIKIVYSISKLDRLLLHLVVAGLFFCHFTNGSIVDNKSS